MPNPLDYLIKDPDAMRYELMRSQAEGMAGGGLAKAVKAGVKAVDLLKSEKALSFPAVKLTDSQIAHQVAQRNAALPIDQGGLGLHIDNTAMDRASAMGFDIDTVRYHGTDKDISAFDPKKFGEKDPGWYGRGVTTSTSPETASAYADYHEPVSGQNVMPVFTKGKYMEWPESSQPYATHKDAIIGTKDIQNLGYHGTNKTFDADLYGNVPDIQTEQVTFDPKHVRSKFSAFDPFEQHSSDILKANGGAVHMAGGGDAEQANIDQMRYELERARHPVIEATPQSPAQKAIGTVGGYMDRAGKFISETMEPIADSHPIRNYLVDMLLADPLKSAGTAMQDYTKTSRDITEEQPYVRSPITGSGQTLRLDPRVLDIMQFAQPAVGAATKAISAGAKTAIPFAKDVGAMANELYASGRMPGTINPAHPMVAWHGTPNEIKGNKFSNEKIGTGEGAQAYGYGHYLAGNPKVAEGYKAAGETLKYTPTLEKFTNGPNYFIDEAGNYMKYRDWVKNDTPVKIPKEEYLQKFNEVKAIHEAQPSGNLYKVDIADELVPKMLDWDKPLSQQHPDVQAALAKYDPDTYHPSGSDYDPNQRGQWTYMNLAGRSTQKLASQKLSDLGIPGIKYFDQGSRGAGKGSHNMVVFDPEHAKFLEKNGIPITADIKSQVQGVKPGEELIAHHNLSAEKLLGADKLGGMPVPSLAISKASEPLTNFGDITLIAPQELATPSAKNPVFRSDAYTATKPSISYSMDRSSESNFKKLLSSTIEKMPDGEHEFGNTLDKIGDLNYQPLIRSKFLEDKGILPNKNEFKSKYDFESEVNSLTNKNRDEYESWLNDFQSSLPDNGVDIKEKIFKGYTNLGNRRYADATLENFVKEMKGIDNRQSWFGGPAYLRAVATPKFKNIKEVKAERSKVTTPEEFAKVKDETDKKFFDLTGQLREIGRYDPSDALLEIAETRNPNVLDRIYGEGKVSPELKKEIGSFITGLKSLPTEYFEAKPQRAVGLSEFAGAIIPKNSSAKVRSTLEKHGITDVHEYSTSEERVSLFKKYGKHMFAAPPAAIGAGVISAQQEDNNMKHGGKVQFANDIDAMRHELSKG